MRAVGYAGALVARRATSRVRAHFSALFPFTEAWGCGMLGALSLWPVAGRLVFPWVTDDGRLVPPWRDRVFDFVQAVSGAGGALMDMHVLDAASISPTYFFVTRGGSRGVARTIICPSRSRPSLPGAMTVACVFALVVAAAAVCGPPVLLDSGASETMTGNRSFMRGKLTPEGIPVRGINSGHDLVAVFFFFFLTNGPRPVYRK